MIKVFLLLSVLFFANNIFPSVCTFKNEPDIIEENDELLAMIYEETYDEAFFNVFEGGEEDYNDYVTWVKENFMTDPYELLERQKNLFIKFGFSVYNYNLILNQEAGLIRDINCLEVLLFLEHHAFSPLEASPSEFLAYVLKKGDALRIYFTSVKELQANSQFFYDDVVHDVDEGWTYLTNIHNHPFVANNAAGDIAGTTIPSGGDLLLYRKHRDELELQTAWITNGISSIAVRSDEFDLFEVSDH